jgi:hypothetical protein
MFLFARRRSIRRITLGITAMANTADRQHASQFDDGERARRFGLAGVSCLKQP